MAVEFGVEVGVRDDDELGVEIHSDPLIELYPPLVGDVEEPPEEVGVLARVLDDGRDAVAL